MQRSPSSRLKAIASNRSCEPAGRTQNFTCFSPTTRVPSISNSPSNAGLRKGLAPGRGLAQQLAPSRGSARSRLQLAVGPDHVVAVERASQRRPPSRRPARNRRGAAARIVRPAAIAWPPKRSISAGSRVATASSTSRMCTPGNRTRRAAQRRAVVGRREGDHRPADAILDAARHETDHALVPARVEQTDAVRWRSQRAARSMRAHGRERLDLHVALDLAAAAGSAHPVAAAMRPASSAESLQQATDAEAHVLETPGGVEPRSDRETEVAGDDAGRRCAARPPAARGCPARSVPRGCAAGPARPGCGCSHRAAPGRPRCRARPGRAARRRAARPRAAALTAAARDAALPARRTRRRRRPAPGCRTGCLAGSGFTMTVAAGSARPGRWWSVISTSMPSAFARRATPSKLEMPLSTVTSSVGCAARPRVRRSPASARIRNGTGPAR